MMFPLIKRFRACWGHDKYSAETFDRLIHSMHVQDLRWIASVTTGAAAFAIASITIIAYKLPPEASKLCDVFLPLQISAVLAGLGGIIAWCYQTGSARLGMVDLFACEITTLCRICTINGLADTCITEFSKDLPSERFSHFDSSEAYTPIFDANAKELRNLSVKVVTNITAFYTYWKATRDAFRKLAKIQAPKADTIPGADLWHRAMRDVIYMQFLACESARRAVRDLIEFEPNRAENTIMILLSELPGYGSLLKHFPEGDARHTRLNLRLDRYQSVVPQVYYHTEDEHAKYNHDNTAKKTFLHPRRRKALEELRSDWDKAYGMLDDLKSRYEVAIDKFPRRDAVILSNKLPDAELPHSPRVDTRVHSSA